MAVLPSSDRPGRRLSGTRYPSDRRKRELLQPDSAGRDPSDPGRGRARRVRRCRASHPMQWGPDGELIYLLGATKAEFGGSAVATCRSADRDAAGGRPGRRKVLAEILVAGSRDRMLTAAHDVADGGVGLALAEMAMRAGTGARTWVPDGIDAFTFLFSESAARALVVVPRSEELRFTEMCGARRFP